MWVLLGCSSDDVNQAKLDEALSRARADDAPRVTRQGRSVPFASLPAHVATLTLQFTVGKGTMSRDRVSIRREVTRGAGGKYVIRDERTWSNPDLALRGVDDGRNVIFNGERLVSQRRWGPWKERDFWRGEHLDLLAAAYDIFPAMTEAFKPYLSWTDPEKTTLLGRSAEKRIATYNTTPVMERLTKEQISGLRKKEGGWAQWIAQTHRPEEIYGEVIRVKGEDQVLTGQITITGTAEVDGQRHPFSVSLTMKVTPLQRKNAFALPKRILPKGRARTWSMITQVLGDALNPIYMRTKKPGAKPKK